MACEKTGHVARTYVKLVGHVEHHIKAALGGLPLSAIAAQDVRAWVRSMSDAGLEPSTVKAIYRTFGQVMKTAEIDRLVERSPCVGIELPKDRKREQMHFLSHDQVHALAEAICWKRLAHGHGSGTSCTERRS